MNAEQVPVPFDSQRKEGEYHKAPIVEFGQRGLNIPCISFNQKIG